MFEAATFRKFDEANLQAVDIGRLLECALYYGRIDIYMHTQMFVGFIKKIGVSGLQSMLSCPTFKFTLITEGQGVTDGDGGEIKVYSPVAFSMAYSKKRNSSMEPIDILNNAFSRNKDWPQVSRADIKKLIGKMSIGAWSDILHNEYQENKLWKLLASDSNTLKLAIPFTAKRRNLILNEENLRRANFDIIELQDGLLPSCSMNLADIAAPIGDSPPLTWGDIFVEIEQYRTDLYLAQNKLTDVIADSATLDFASKRADLALLRASGGTEKLSAFNEMNFDNASPLGEAFNMGHLRLGEALNLIDKAGEFKRWIQSQPSDVDLIKQYIQGVGKVAKIDKFPGRDLRFIMTCAIGVGLGSVLDPNIGLAAGAALNALDTYFVSEVFKSWRPNMFVSEMDNILKKAKIRADA